MNIFVKLLCNGYDLLWLQILCGPLETLYGSRWETLVCTFCHCIKLTTGKILKPQYPKTAANFLKLYKISTQQQTHDAIAIYQGWPLENLLITTQVENVIKCNKRNIDW